MSASAGSPRIVIDTNLIVSAEIVLGSAPAQVLNAWRENRCEVVTSEALAGEVADVLARPSLRRYRFSSARVRTLLDALRARIEPALPEDQLPVHCRDSGDDKVLAAALGAGADYIVTGDRDLLALDGHAALGRLRIVTPAQFLALLGQTRV